MLELLWVVVVLSAKKTISKSSSRKVKNISTGKVYNSIKEAGKETKINESAISNCCRGVSKTAGGYHWKYIKNEP